jgi:hypothetical protein
MEISEEELQKKLDVAREEAARYEQWRNAWIQAVRIVKPHLDSLADQYDPQTNKLVKLGALDRFVYHVFETECDKITREYFPRPEKELSPGSD